MLRGCLVEWLWGGAEKRTNSDYISKQRPPRAGVSFLEGKEDILEDWREKFFNTWKV